jgi:hypothetical protein
MSYKFKTLVNPANGYAVTAAILFEKINSGEIRLTHPSRQIYI